MTTDGTTPDSGVWVDPLPELDEPDEREDAGDDRSDGSALAQNARE